MGQENLLDCRTQQWVGTSERLCGWLISIPLPSSPCLSWPYRNSSTMDLTLFAAEAIALNRQLSQHEENELAEEQEALAEGLCSMKLSPPSKSRLARRRALAQAGRSRDANPCSTPAGL